MKPKKVKKYFDVAKATSHLSNITKQSIGAVIVSKNGDIIGVGANSKKTHPYQAKLARKFGHEQQIYLHGELAALVSCKQRNLHGSSIFVYRESGGKPAMARPCFICMSAIKEYGIKNIYYTTMDGYCYEYVQCV